MLAFLTVVIMLGVGAVHVREGLWAGFTMCVNVLIAGLIAFNFWEPVAAAMEPAFQDTFLAGCEDALCLVLLFVVPLGSLRVATTLLLSQGPEFHPAVQHGGGALFGLLAGYLAAGFLICLVQTLPVQEEFLGFDTQPVTGPSAAIRKVLPPDRVWLGLMRRAGSYSFSNYEYTEPDSQKLEDRYVTFDKDSTFEQRYAHYRRKIDESTGKPMPYQGEFDKSIRKN